MTDWFTTLKMVYNNSWTFLKDFPVSNENPFAILTATDLPGETWENIAESYYKPRKHYTSVTSPPTKNREVSDFGRAKEDGRIVVPELVRNYVGYDFKGPKHQYKGDRYKSGKRFRGKEGHQSKHADYPSGKMNWRWAITVDWALANDIDIPDDTRLLNPAGRDLGTYGDFKEESEF